MKKQRVALITGVMGQDGYYLSKLLLEKGYKVFGTDSKEEGDSDYSDWEGVEIIHVDMRDKKGLCEVVRLVQPDELYNLAAQSFIPTSWDDPYSCMDVNGLGVLRLLECIRDIKPDARLFQASSAEMFAGTQKSPQNESTAFIPTNPYGSAKVFAHNVVRNYREQFGIYACSGILYNHESPRRGLEFVTRKIIEAVKCIKDPKRAVPLNKFGEPVLEDDGKLHLGNLDTVRDWGFAGDYVKIMCAMLQQKKPDDFVISSGKGNSVRNFVKAAFMEVGIDNWEDYVVEDKRFWRPKEKVELIGDNSKLKRAINIDIASSIKQLVCAEAL